jgi:glycosyltransferase involved in cell wall biosynthesis
MAGKIAVLLSCYPRMSETFVAQELLGLERAGLDIEIISLMRPETARRQPVNDEIRAPVHYLPYSLIFDLPAFVAAWRRQRRQARYGAAFAVFRRDLRRDFTSGRIRRFAQALVVADRLAPRYNRLHANFIHKPATVADYVGLLTGLAWTCSAHAKDIWTEPEWDLRQKLERLQWVVACTRHGVDRLRALAADPSRVHLSYHGLDLARFAPLAGSRPPRTGADAADSLTILAVGRTVPKKGFDTLLQALALLPPELAWRLDHIGSGGESEMLQAAARTLGIADRIDWLGTLDQPQVLEHYRRADLFVLPCRIAADGDRDGLPNVLVEAASQRLAIVSTTVAAIPELIRDGAEGLLVPPADPARLAAALLRLARDPELRDMLGRNAERRVRSEFDHHGSIAFLMALFDGRRAAA